MSDTQSAAPPEWFSRIDIRDLGALAGTASRVQAVVGDEKSSLGDLARVLQNDPTLVSKVLRIANSPGYMVTSEPVTTVSRASSLMGFDTVRNVCITNRVLEALLQQRKLPASVQDRLLRRVAASLHAAAQARMLSIRSGRDRQREEAFLGALLARIGESAFWSAGGPDVEALDEALAEPDCDARSVVVKRLGADFDELSRTLVRAWGLEEAANPPATGYESAATGPSHGLIVQIANEIADAAAEAGWQSERMKSLVPRVARMLSVENDEASIRMRACGKQAEELAACYGAAQLAKRMTFQPQAAESTQRSTRPRAAAAANLDPAVGGDSAIQLKVLRQMSTMSLDGKSDINSVIRMAMDGVHDGIGMERTLTALLTPDRRDVVVRLWLGDGGEEWSKGFRLQVGNGRNVVHECIAELKSARFDARNPGVLGNRIPPALMRFSAGQDFMLAPVAVGTRSIGLIYTDRAPGGRAINEQEFAAFVHFSQQLGSCLAQLTQRRA